MAIRKLKSGSFQARLPGTDGRMLTKAFPTRLEAEEQEVRWKREKKDRKLKSHNVRQLTLDTFFIEWFEALACSGSGSGWRKNQLQLYRDFVSPLIGEERLSEIRPRSIQLVLLEMARRGKSEQTRVHVFGLLRKMFGDAIETYEYVSYSPVLRKLKPKLVVKEARHLNKDQAVRLLTYVDYRRYGTAIWLQLFSGLRLGEVQGLRWDDVDLETGRLTVRRVFVGKTGSFREYPKGGKQRVQTMPPELLARLRRDKSVATAALVAPSPNGNVLPYKCYRKALSVYCSELKIPSIGTHGLRHSTSELYLSHGATRDDVRQLLGHASPSTTERYMHGRNPSLDKVSNVIRLFSEKNTKMEHASDFDRDRISN